MGRNIGFWLRSLTTFSRLRPVHPEKLCGSSTSVVPIPVFFIFQTVNSPHFYQEKLHHLGEMTNGFQHHNNNGKCCVGNI